MNDHTADSPAAISLPPTKPMDLSHLVEAALRPGRPAGGGEQQSEGHEGSG